MDIPELRKKLFQKCTFHLGYECPSSGFMIRWLGYTRHQTGLLPTRAPRLSWDETTADLIASSNQTMSFLNDSYPYFISPHRTHNMPQTYFDDFPDHTSPMDVSEMSCDGFEISNELDHISTSSRPHHGLPLRSSLQSAPTHLASVSIIKLFRLTFRSNRPLEVI